MAAEDGYTMDEILELLSKIETVPIEWMMKKLSVSIIRFVDEHQPGWVEAELVDADGESHRFVDKVPIFSERDLVRSDTYPQPGQIRCVAISESRHADGRVVVEVSTASPDGVESTTGMSRFMVASTQLSD